MARTSVSGVVAFGTAPTRTRTVKTITAQHSGDVQSVSMKRRGMAALLTASPLMWMAREVWSVPPAFALIPDDDDEELVEKARANRKSRLANEKATEKAFSRSEGFVNREEKRDLIPIQRAVNSLGLVGQQLAAGDVGNASNTLSGPWTTEFRAAAESLSTSNKATISQLASQLTSLQQAAKSGLLSDAKREYVAVVGTLENWASQAGVAASLKGL
jgi:hypothetical protein